MCSISMYSKPIQVQTLKFINRTSSIFSIVSPKKSKAEAKEVERRWQTNKMELLSVNNSQEIEANHNKGS